MLNLDVNRVRLFSLRYDIRAAITVRRMFAPAIRQSDFLTNSLEMARLCLQLRTETYQAEAGKQEEDQEPLRHYKLLFEIRIP